MMLVDIAELTLQNERTSRLSRWNSGVTCTRMHFSAGRARAEIHMPARTNERGSM